MSAQGESTRAAIRKVAFLGDYLPRKCGIATVTTDLRCAVAAKYPGIRCLVVPVNDAVAGYDYPAEVRFEIVEQDLTSYLRASDFLNITDVEVVCVQHEFGIYGGRAGSHVLALPPRRARGAFTLIGIDEYLQRLSGDRHVNQIRESLMNAAPMLETGLKALRWLVKVQTSEIGAFRPIGSNGFYRRGQERAQFHQQPIEAQATVSEQVISPVWHSGRCRRAIVLKPGNPFWRGRSHQ